MADVVINQGQVGIIHVTGQTDAGVAAPVTGTATIDNYDTAYVASTGVKDEYMIVPKVTLQPGQKVTVSVKFSAVASDGTAIADFAVSFELDGAVQPVATHLVLGATSTPNAADVTVPPDPGSATIPIA